MLASVFGETEAGTGGGGRVAGRQSGRAAGGQPGTGRTAQGKQGTPGYSGLGYLTVKEAPPRVKERL